MRDADGNFIPIYLYPAATLDAPPTVAGGHLTLDQENRNRALGCLIIAKVGRMLRLSQSMISTAQVLLHRFYFRVSMHQQKLLQVCMTAVHVSSKISETPIMYKELFTCFDRILKRRSGLDTTPLHEARYYAWMESTKRCESIMLAQLGYELYVDLPHKFILHFINYMKPIDNNSSTSSNINKSKDDSIEDETKVSDAELDARVRDPSLWSSLNQHCWNVLNDCLLSHRVLFTYPPELIACAAIHTSATQFKLQLPDEWWKLFDMETRTLFACVADIERIYELLQSSSDTSAASSSSSSSTSSSAPPPLDYIPTDASDTVDTNELIRYPVRNRAKLLIERQAQIDELRAKQKREASEMPAATNSNAMEQ